MKKIVITLTALAGITLSGCAYGYGYGPYGSGYGPYGYGYGQGAYGYALPGTATVTTTYGAPLASSSQLSAGVAAGEATGEDAATQMSTGEDAATQMSTGEEAAKTDEKAAGDGQTP